MDLIPLPFEISPFYESVKPISDRWFEDIITKETNINIKKYMKILDTALVISLTIPYGSEENILTSSKYMWWIFYQDELFDENNYCNNDCEAVKGYWQRTNCVFDGTPCDSKDLCYLMFKEVYQLLDLTGTAKQELQQGLNLYYQDLLRVVETRNRQEKNFFDISVDEYRNLRAGHVGVQPIFALIPYARGIEVETNLLNDPLIVGMRAEASMVLAFLNDICSIHKEVSRKDLNLVDIFMKRNDWDMKRSIDEVVKIMVGHYEKFIDLMEEAKKKFTGDAGKLQYVGDLLTAFSGLCHWQVRDKRYTLRLEDQPLPDQKEPDLSTIKQCPTRHQK